LFEDDDDDDDEEEVVDDKSSICDADVVPFAFDFE